LKQNIRLVCGEVIYPSSALKFNTERSIINRRVDFVWLHTDVERLDRVPGSVLVYVGPSGRHPTVLGVVSILNIDRLSGDTPHDSPEARRHEVPLRIDPNQILAAFQKLMHVLTSLALLVGQYETARAEDTGNLRSVDHQYRQHCPSIGDVRFRVLNRCNREFQLARGKISNMIIMCENIDGVLSNIVLL